MKRTNYTYRVDGSILAIVDLNGAHSVTVDAEAVLMELQVALGSLAGLLITWRDTKGTWDGLAYQQGKVYIYSLNTVSYPATRYKLLNLSGTGRL